MPATANSSIRRRRFVVLWLGMAASLVFPCRGKGQAHPTDAQLKRKFTARRGDLEKLVKMADEDQHLVRIASNFTWLDTDASWPRNNIGMSPARWNAYRLLFEQFGIHGGISRRVDFPESVFFLVSGRGIVPSGSTKGIVYSLRQLSPIRESLDGLKPTDKGLYFEKIDENWYLFVDNNP
jgi:hypothetical protein